MKANPGKKIFNAFHFMKKDIRIDLTAVPVIVGA